VAFLDLEEQRIVVPVAEEESEIGARADAADAHDPVRDVRQAVSAQHEPVFGGELLPVLDERRGDLATSLGVDARQASAAPPT
jgi:hypothetical protein